MYLPVQRAKLVLAAFASISNTVASSAYPVRCATVSPPPSMTACGLNATTSVDYHSLSHAQNLADCRSTCYREGYCKTFSFDARTLECRLYRKRSALLSLHDVANGSAFYDLACFHCSLLCPEPLGAELVTNGGFEDETSVAYIGPWLHAQEKQSRVALVAGYNSPHALACIVNTDDPGLMSEGCLLSQSFRQCHRSFGFYSFSFDYKLQPNPQHNLPFEFYLITGSRAYNYFVVNSSTASGQWTTVQGIVSNLIDIPTSQNNHTPYRVNAFCGDYYHRVGNASCITDNFSVKRISNGVPTIKPGAPELLGNGGFDDSTSSVTPWRIDLSPNERSGYAITSPGLDGSAHALTFSTNATTYDSLAGTTLTLSQTVSTVPGSHYLLTYKAVIIAGTVVGNGPTFTADLHMGDPATDATYQVFGGEILKNVTEARMFVLTPTQSETTFDLVLTPTDIGVRQVTLDSFSLKQISV